MLDVKGFASEGELRSSCETVKGNNSITSVLFRGNIPTEGKPKKLDYDITIYDEDIKWQTKRLFYKHSKYKPHQGSTNICNLIFIYVCTDIV